MPTWNDILAEITRAGSTHDIAELSGTRQNQSKLKNNQMENGGARPGAGRPKGSPNKATKERQARIAAAGVTPLDVMIADMRFHWDAHQKAMADKNGAEAAKELALARDAAKDAAPYTHPRLAAVEHMGKGGGPIEYTDVRDRLAHLVDRAAAADESAEDSRTTH